MKQCFTMNEQALVVISNLFIMLQTFLTNGYIVIQGTWSGSDNAEVFGAIFRSKDVGIGVKYQAV